MDNKLFTKNDSGFICGNCGKEVEPLGYSSRNHCPFCLWSRHLDVNPGDRQSECKGLMEPISAEPTGDGFIITHRCVICGKTIRNKAATKGKSQTDDINLLINLTVNRN